MTKLMKKLAKKVARMNDRNAFDEDGRFLPFVASFSSRLLYCSVSVLLGSSKLLVELRVIPALRLVFVEENDMMLTGPFSFYGLLFVGVSL